MSKRSEKFNPMDEYEPEINTDDHFTDWERLEAEWEEIPFEIRMAESGMFPVNIKNKKTK